MPSRDDSLRTRLLEGVRLAQAGDWQAAHLIAQDHEGDEIANWIHAVAHRMEGDLSNARYWYGRCGRSLRDKLDVQAELAEIETALGGSDAPGADTDP